MAIKTTDKKKSIVITSTHFEDVYYFIGESGRKSRIAQGGRYYNFAGDNPLNQYSDVNAGHEISSKLAVANYLMAMKLWKMGIAECNEWVNKHARNYPEKSITVKCPGEIWVDDEEEIEAEAAQ
jgi:hypothetical protein